ncbi:hypothetical protein [Streptosporangium subroseum]|uniref:hypothetical protein n=1 Tax=Streptosporangium subroseum TaxID=106412 RepID=UPI00308EA93C|nr:hypothetical protein OHB15_15755 [Streptosporangium subroseum]
MSAFGARRLLIAQFVVSGHFNRRAQPARDTNEARDKDARDDEVGDDEDDH